MPSVPNLPNRSSLDEQALGLVSDAVGLLRLRGDGLCSVQLTAPWGLSFPAEGGIYLHFFQQSGCLLQRAGSEEVLAVSAGDLVILSDGCAHHLVDSLGGPVVPIRSIATKRTGFLTRLHHGGGGRATHLLGGKFFFDERLRVALPGFPPPVLHVRGSRGTPPEWLGITMRFLAAEAERDALGRSIAISSLIDVLFVQAVRHWLQTQSEGPRGWMGALRDPQISSALVLMHQRPDAPWDVKTLANKVGMSRSSFAQRFVELVGESPNRYLTRWRVHHAARLLSASGMTVAEAAARVGYNSEAAFSRIFKRYMGVPPTTFRVRRGSARPPRRRGG